MKITSLFSRFRFPLGRRPAGRTVIIRGPDGPTAIFSTSSDIKENNMDYKRISQKEAKRILDSGEECTLLDVRDETEFDEGHIPGAKLLPLGDMMDIAEEELPDKDAAILVYCRSGRRSKMAAAMLCSLGYTDVREFGGILDWPYEIEK